MVALWGLQNAFWLYPNLVSIGIESPWVKPRVSSIVYFSFLPFTCRSSIICISSKWFSCSVFPFPPLILSIAYVTFIYLVNTLVVL